MLQLTLTPLVVRQGRGLLAISLAVNAILNNERARYCPRQTTAGAGYGEGPRSRSCRSSSSHRQRRRITSGVIGTKGASRTRTQTAYRQRHC